jgi:sugar/nucleoside kinase (ribokinase family)
MRALLPARPPGVLARRPQQALPAVLTTRRMPALPARALGSSASAAASTVGRARRLPAPTRQQQQRRRRRGAATIAASTSNGNGNGRHQPQQKLYDVVGVSNLCVDVVLPVDALPPADPRARRALLSRLQRHPPSLDAWEVGGSCNFMIAAARLGLRVAAVGHTGADPAGRYLEAVLEGEGVGPLLQLARAAGGEGEGEGEGEGGEGACAAAAAVVASGPAGAAAALAAALQTAPGADHHALLEEQERLRQQAVLAAAQQAAALAASSSSCSSSSPEATATDARAAAAAQTLLCFVLVDPAGGHAFCSAYDFGPWPLLADALEASAEHRWQEHEEGGSDKAAPARAAANGNNGNNNNTSALLDQQAQDDAAAAERLLPPSVLRALRATRALYLNGFVFDELPLPIVRACCRAASASGAAVFFDPGPRAHTMREGERRAALDAVLDLADVVLMTEEEAAEVTGIEGDAGAAARAVLARPGCRTRWSVVKRGPQGAVLVAASAEGAANGEASSSYLHYASPAVPVDVTDTVGCGDSFAAAAVLGFTRGACPEETLALANAVGAATAMGRGAGTNVASAPRVLGLLEGASRRRRQSGGGQEAAAAEGAIRMLRAALREGGWAAAAAVASAALLPPAAATEEEAVAAAVAAAREEAAAKQQRQQQQRQQQQQQPSSRPARRQPTTAA